MNKITKNIIKEYYESNSREEHNDLKLDFENVLDIFITEHIGEGGETLFCKIHDNFPKGHNCVGCNLNESNIRIENFLIQYKLFDDIHLTFTSFIILLYLHVESIYEYFEIIQLQESYRYKHFNIFQEVKRWANFLKHPKSFMLVHHPVWTYEGRKITNEGNLEKNKKTSTIINSAFVNKFYAGNKKNRDLYNKLNKKADVLVCFPNPVELIKEFTKAQKKFSEMIANNEIVRDLLENKTTIENHFIKETDE